MDKGHKKWLDYLLRALLVAGLLYVLYLEVGKPGELSRFWSEARQRWQSESGYWLLPAVLLMPVNWGLESLKWQQLLRPFWRLPFWRAYRAVTAGVALSLFTPNRVGDYGGRVLAVPAAHNWQAVLSTMAGNIAQLLALLTGGLIGALYYLREQSGLSELMLGSFWWLGVGILGLSYLIYFNMAWLEVLFRQLPIKQAWRRHLVLIGRFHRRALLLALGLSLLRYLVYCLQYYFMVRFFGIEAPLYGALSGIALIFLFQASVPLPPLAALLARGEAAILVWGAYTDDHLSVLTATFGLFILNLCLPALLGLGFIVKINVLKSLGYEQ